MNGQIFDLTGGKNIDKGVGANDEPAPVTVVNRLLNGAISERRAMNLSYNIIILFLYKILI